MANSVALSLGDAVFSVTNCEDNLAICARQPFTSESEAVLVSLTPDYRVPDEVLEKGFSYFLGKEDTLRLLEVLSERRVSRQAQVEFLAHFATFDTYPSWFDALPER